MKVAAAGQSWLARIEVRRGGGVVRRTWLRCMLTLAPERPEVKSAEHGHGPHRGRTSMTVTIEESADATAIRPFTIETPEADIEDLRARIAATHWPEKETVPDHSQGVPLATMQKLARYWATDYDWRRCEAQAERAAAVHHRDRRARHPLHPRPLAARGRVAARRQSRMARLDHRAAEDHRSADRSDGPRRERGGRVPRGDPVDAGLRVLGQADGHRLGPRAHGPGLGGADEAPRLHPLRRPGRRLGRVRRRPDGPPGTGGTARASTPTCPPRCRPTSTRPPWPATRRHPVSRPRNDARTTADQDVQARSSTPG